MAEEVAPAPHYAVVRAAADLPPGFLPAELDGKWFDLHDMPHKGIRSHFTQLAGLGAVAVPSGRFEVREDGAVAEVYEVRP